MTDSITDGPGIVVTGASGRMGRMLVQTITGSDKARLVGAVERAGAGAYRVLRHSRRRYRGRA